ncbi:hypothetical protein ACFL3X_01815 [Gemmatimonadota bacterium]
MHTSRYTDEQIVIALRQAEAGTLVTEICRKAEDSGFNATILAELTEIGDKADLRPLLDEYVAGIARVHFKLRELLMSQVNGADDCLLRLIDRYKEQRQEQVKGLVAAEIDHSGRISEEVQLFEDLTLKRKSLVRRTLHAPHIVGLFTTNEPHET